MVTFKTKTGKIVTFKAKGEKTRPRKAKKNTSFPIRSVKKSPSRPRPKRKPKMAKRKRSSRKGSSSGGLMNVLLGGAVAGFIGSMVPFGNYGKIGVAAIAHKQGGILGSTAKALGTIGAAQIVQGSGITPSSALTSATSAAATW